MTDRDPSLSAQVKERDDWTCQKCGAQPEGQTVEAHHPVPLDVGGEDSLENLSTLCQRCHQYAPSWLLPIADYRAAFDSYLSTGMRADYDLLQFGAQATQKHPDVFSETGIQVFQMMGSQAQRGEKSSAPKSPSSLWFYGALLADHDEIRDITDDEALSGVDFSRFF